MNRFKFDNEKKMCLQVGTKENGRPIWKKYKPYAIGELPTSFGFIYDENKDMKEEMLLSKIKSNKLVEKYLKDKSIDKIIFVKNRLINLLVNE